MKRWLQELENANEMNVLLGVWLILSPGMLGFSDAHRAAWDAWVLGAALVIAGVLSVYVSERADEAATLILGEVTFLSPWVLSFGKSAVPAWNATVVGLLAVAVALRAMLKHGALGDWLRERLGTV